MKIKYNEKIDQTFHAKPTNESHGAKVGGKMCL